MKSFLLIIVALATLSCESQSTGPGSTPQEPVPMGTGRVETKLPSEMKP